MAQQRQANSTSLSSVARQKACRTWRGGGSTVSRVVVNFVSHAETEEARERELQVFMQRLSALLEGRDRHCPKCGTEVARLKRRRNSILAEPCNCHIYQGDHIPAPWRQR